MISGSSLETNAPISVAQLLQKFDFISFCKEISLY